jgi:hypothetical protein
LGHEPENQGALLQSLSTQKQKQKLMAHRPGSYLRRLRRHHRSSAPVLLVQ